jgi:hypothetical protein
MNITTADAQAAIFDALEDRGYTTGLHYEQLAARQIAKMLEEVCEAAACVAGFSPVMQATIGTLHQMARSEFDDRTRWQDRGRIISLSGLRAELADVAVTLANAAEAVSWYDECKFDVMQEAVGKATADVSRGVR